MSTLATRKEGTLSARYATVERGTTAARRIVNTTSEARFMPRIVAQRLVDVRRARRCSLDQ
jgi:hypothetical protein